MYIYGPRFTEVLIKSEKQVKQDDMRLAGSRNEKHEEINEQAHERKILALWNWWVFDSLTHHF